jgi:hypothetical protein
MSVNLMTIKIYSEIELITHTLELIYFGREGK